MTNLDSILKSRDITLPTKVRLVKAMVFPGDLPTLGIELGSPAFQVDFLPAELPGKPNTYITICKVDRQWEFAV